MLRPVVRSSIGTAASFIGGWALTGWLDELGFGASAKALVWMGCAAVVLWLWLTDDSRLSIRRALFRWRAKRPLMAFVIAALAGAVVFPLLLWLITLKPPPERQSEPEEAIRAGDASTVQGVRALLEPIRDTAYRDVVAEVIHSFEPDAHITVGGAVIGPDGARTVDVQVVSRQRSSDLRVAAIDVIDRPDGRPVDIDMLDGVESKHRDIRVDAMLVCSDTGFTPAAITKAKRTKIGLISVLRQGDGRVGAVIEEEIFLRRVTVTPVRISYEGPKVQPGVTRRDDPPIKEHDLKYRGASVDAWLESRFVIGLSGVKSNGPVTFYYRLRKPTNFDLPGGGKRRVTKLSISTEVQIEWLSQVVQLDATNAIYDYLRGRVRLGPGQNKYEIKGINWETATPVPEPPLDSLSFGLLPGEVGLALMYVRGGPVGAKGSPEIDALIEPEDLRSDPPPVFPMKAQ